MQQVEDNLKVVVSEGERLTKLIDDVLDLAKIEAGKLEWHMETASRRPSSSIAPRRPPRRCFDQKGLRLVKDIAADLPTVTGDRDRLIQVVINLISNAVKFTDAGIVTLPRRRARRRDRRQRHRHGHGHRAGGPAEGVRAVQAGGRHAHRQAERHRPGPADLPGDRRASRRPHLGRQRARAAAARSRSRCRSPAEQAAPPAAAPVELAALIRQLREQVIVTTPRTTERAAAHPRRRRRPEHPRAAARRSSPRRATR